MNNLPVDTQKKIDDEAELRYPVEKHNTPNDSPYVSSQKTFRHGVSFGYSLCLQEKEERIKGLEEGFKKVKEYCDDGEITGAAALRNIEQITDKLL